MKIRFRLRTVAILFLAASGYLAANSRLSQNTREFVRSIDALDASAQTHLLSSVNDSNSRRIAVFDPSQQPRVEVLPRSLADYLLLRCECRVYFESGTQSGRTYQNYRNTAEFSIGLNSVKLLSSDEKLGYTLTG